MITKKGITPLLVISIIVVSSVLASLMIYKWYNENLNASLVKQDMHLGTIRIIEKVYKAGVLKLTIWSPYGREAVLTSIKLVRIGSGVTYPLTPLILEIRELGLGDSISLNLLSENKWSIKKGELYSIRFNNSTSLSDWILECPESNIDENTKDITLDGEGLKILGKPATRNIFSTGVYGITSREPLINHINASVFIVHLEKTRYNNVNLATSYFSSSVYVVPEARIRPFPDMSKPWFSIHIFPAGNQGSRLLLQMSSPSNGRVMKTLYTFQVDEVPKITLMIILNKTGYAYYYGWIPDINNSTRFIKGYFRHASLNDMYQYQFHIALTLLTGYNLETMVNYTLLKVYKSTKLYLTNFSKDWVIVLGTDGSNEYNCTYSGSNLAYYNNGVEIPVCDKLVRYGVLKSLKLLIYTYKPLEINSSNGRNLVVVKPGKNIIYLTTPVPINPGVYLAELTFSNGESVTTNIEITSS